MRDWRSAGALLPVIAFALFGLFLVVAVADGVRRRNDELMERARNDIQQSVSRIARLADQTDIASNQLLEDSLTHEAADERNAAAVVIDHSGKIVSTSNFSWRNQPVSRVYPGYDGNLIRRAMREKMAILVEDAEKSRLHAILGFTELAHRSSVRGFEKGVVIFTYDLTEQRSRIFKNTLIERGIEILAGLVAASSFVFFVNRFLASPLRRLRNAADAFAFGAFDEPIKLAGFSEIADLGDSFNHMAASLKSSMQSLENQFRKTETILNSVADGILTIDVGDKIVTFNRAAELIFGYSAREAQGMSIMTLLPGLRDIDRSIRTESEPVAWRKDRVDGVRKDGSYFPVEFAVNRIDDLGRTMFVGVVRDITERDKIDRMQKEFISTVSHELRTPLTAINGSIALIKNVYMKNPGNEHAEIVNIAERNGERLLNLINDLLDFEKILAGKMQFDIHSCDLRLILSDVVRMNETYAGKFDIRIDLREVKETIIVAVDEIRLGQVLTNLISNACKFSPPGSVVEVTTELRADRVRVSVVDSGEGISEEFRDRIFQKFSQADGSDRRRFGGTGLGLAISKGIIENLHGKIGFESKKGVGSTFYFELPLAA